MNLNSVVVKAGKKVAGWGYWHRQTFCAVAEVNGVDISQIAPQFLPMTWANTRPVSPPCAWPQPQCKDTVEFGRVGGVAGECYYAGSVNWYLYGYLMKVCGDYQWEAVLAVTTYKTIGRGANKKTAVGFVKAAGSGVFPPGDRSQCATTCTVSVPPGQVPFTWHWAGGFE